MMSYYQQALAPVQVLAREIEYVTEKQGIDLGRNLQIHRQELDPFGKRRDVVRVCGEMAPRAGRWARAYSAKHPEKKLWIEDELDDECLIYVG